MMQKIWPKAKFSLNLAVQIEKEAAGDAELKATRKFKVPAFAVALASRKLWSRSLTEKRDQQLSEQMQGKPARTIQALRGHVTRQLLKELEPILEKVKGK